MADKPLRHFRGIRVSQSTLKSIFKKNKTSEDVTKAINNSEKDLKICCSPYDEQGESIYCEEEDIFERKNHDKNFLFKIWEGGVKILEIHYFGKSQDDSRRNVGIIHSVRGRWRLARVWQRRR